MRYIGAPASFPNRESSGWLGTKYTRNGLVDFFTKKGIPFAHATEMPA